MVKPAGESDRQQQLPRTDPREHKPMPAPYSPSAADTGSVASSRRYSVIGGWFARFFYAIAHIFGWNRPTPPSPRSSSTATEGSREPIPSSPTMEGSRETRPSSDDMKERIIAILSPYQQKISNYNQVVQDILARKDIKVGEWKAVFCPQVPFSQLHMNDLNKTTCINTSSWFRIILPCFFSSWAQSKPPLDLRNICALWDKLKLEGDLKTYMPHIQSVVISEMQKDDLFVLDRYREFQFPDRYQTLHSTGNGGQYWNACLQKGIEQKRQKWKEAEQSLEQSKKEWRRQVITKLTEAGALEASDQQKSDAELIELLTEQALIGRWSWEERRQYVCYKAGAASVEEKESDPYMQQWRTELEKHPTKGSQSTPPTTSLWSTVRKATRSVADQTKNLTQAVAKRMPWPGKLPSHGASANPEESAKTWFIDYVKGSQQSLAETEQPLRIDQDACLRGLRAEKERLDQQSAYEQQRLKKIEAYLTQIQKLNKVDNKKHQGHAGRDTSGGLT